MSSSEARGRLRSFIARIERLEEERVALVGDIGEVYKEAGGEGFDTKVMRKVIARRKKDKAALQEEDAMLETYEDALRDERTTDETDPLA